MIRQNFSHQSFFDIDKITGTGRMHCTAVLAHIEFRIPMDVVINTTACLE